MDDFELPPTKKPEDKSFQFAFNIKIRKKFLLYILLPIIVVGLLVYALIGQGIIGSARVSSVSLTVTDTNTAAIEKAQVEIGGVSGETAADGTVTLQEVPRGNQTLSVTKTGFVPHSQAVKLKRGLNNLGAITLEETPVEKVSVTVAVADYITEEKIDDATVNLADISGIHDSVKAIYKLNNVPLGSYELSVSKAGYTTFTTKVTIDKETVTLDDISLVQAGTIVFESNRDRAKRGVFSANYDGSNQKALVARVGDFEDYTPVLGPNQRKLFFTSTRDGIKREDDPNSYKEFMYLVDLDGKNLTKIGETSGSYAVWSPDGGYVGYNRYQADYSKSEIYTYDVVKKLSHQFTGYNSSSFNFSPDGKLIAFSGLKDGEPTRKLYYATSAGADIRTVATSTTNTDFYGMEFTSSNKLRYNYYDPVSRKTRWFEFDLATSATTEISAPAVDRESAIISPDKKSRAYVSTRDGKTNVYISDAEGKNERKLTDLNRVVGNLLWSKDSSFIMFDYRGDGESGRYLVSTNGKAKAKKIVDINLTYYY